MLNSSEHMSRGTWNEQKKDPGDRCKHYNCYIGNSGFYILTAKITA